MALTGLALATTIRTTRMEAIKTAIDAGAGPGTIKFYTTPLPATTGAAISTQTLLGTLTLSDPCGSVTGGVLTFSAISDDISADATGTIAFGRIQDSDGTFVLDGTAGTSGAVFIFNTVAAVSGGVIRVLSATLTDSNA